jgi:hypothetical protein
MDKLVYVEIDTKLSENLKEKLCAKRYVIVGNVYGFQMGIGCDKETQSKSYLMFLREDGSIYNFLQGELRELVERSLLIKKEWKEKDSKINLTWRLNRMGHIELWKGLVLPFKILSNDSDRYIQNDMDVEAFFDHIGIIPCEVKIGDLRHHDYDPGYFDE